MVLIFLCCINLLIKIKINLYIVLLFKNNGSTFHTNVESNMKATHIFFFYFYLLSIVFSAKVDRHNFIRKSEDGLLLKNRSYCTRVQKNRLRNSKRLLQFLVAT